MATHRASRSAQQEEVVRAPSRRIPTLRDVAAREGARVIFGHDMAQWESLGMGDGTGTISYR